MQSPSKALGVLVSLGLFLVSSGCSVRPPPTGLDLQDQLVARGGKPPIVRSGDVDTDLIGSFNNCVQANGPGWGLTVRWGDDRLSQWVGWHWGASNGELLVPLRPRRRPWTSTLAEVTMTAYGPHQPALNWVAPDGEVWHVTMCNEQIDFPTEGDLLRLLERGRYSDPAHVAFDPAQGLLVSLYVSRKGEATQQGTKLLGSSLGIDVYRLTIDGEPLAPDRFSQMAMGTILVSDAAAPER